MRIATLTLIGALGLAASAVSASAAPAAPPAAAPHAANIVATAGGCAWGFHPNRWGHCVRSRHGYVSPYRYRHYSRRHVPSDFVANRLNAQELARSGGGLHYRGPGWGY
jgi:hypothetical protein